MPSFYYGGKENFTNIPINSLQEALLKTVELVLDVMDFNSNLFNKVCRFCFSTIMFKQGLKFTVKLILIK